MGHRTANDPYRRLSDYLDATSVRTPRHDALLALLRELYNPEEADLVARMPWRLSRIDRVAAIAGEPVDNLLTRLAVLARKGLVLDLQNLATGERYFMPSPFVIGIFEFTLMRAGPNADHARRARLLHEYLDNSDFYRANLGDGQQVFIARALPHSGTPEDATEVLIAEDVVKLIEQQSHFAVGTCACRHEREHLGGRHCQTPLETCTAMGSAAEYLIRHGLARAIERSEMLEIVARSREQGLVLCAENVCASVGYICHCCQCCCQLIRGITELGYPKAIATSAYVPSTTANACNGCNACVQACPLGALKASHLRGSAPGDLPSPVLDTSLCIGCGVCVTRCRHHALKLVETARRRILPQNSFERIILQSLERGTLQNLVFDNPSSGAQAAMRELLGALLRLPRVQRVLVSDAFRSVFLQGLAMFSGYEGP